MTTFLTIPLFLFLFNSQVNITIVDSETHETLSGVVELNSSEYTDLNGNLRILRGSDLDLRLISYENINISGIKNDTTIYLSQVD